MKDWIKRIINCIIVLILTVAMLAGVTRVLERKESRNKYEPFFEHADDIDVLFLGTSHVLNGVFPMELWHDRGITSYNFGGHGNEIATSYWVMINALDYCDPDVIFIDCTYISSRVKGSLFSYMHQSLDAFPLSVNKIRASVDLSDDPDSDWLVSQSSQGAQTKARTPMEYIWDYSVYHSRWNELTKADFVSDNTLEYGAESRIGIVKPAESVPNTGEKISDERNGMTYLYKMIEECQSRGIEPILMYMPYPATEITWEESNTVSDIADRYGIKSINFMENNVIDLSTDMYDSTSHINPSGARKITGRLGEFMEENCKLTDHREEPSYSYWDEDYSAYDDLKISNLRAQEDLNTYLMLLYDHNYVCDIRINDKSVLNDDTTVALLNALNIDTSRISPDPDYDCDVVIDVYRSGDIGGLLDTAMFEVDYVDGTEGHKYDEAGDIALTSLAKRVTSE